MENQVAGFLVRTIWLAGPNPNHLSNKRACVSFARFSVEYMGRARSPDKVSSEWERPMVQNIYITIGVFTVEK